MVYTLTAVKVNSYSSLVKLRIEFDDYESALLRKARRELTVIAKRNGKTPPTMKDVVRGSVRMGVHAVYGEEYITDNLLDQVQHADLVPKDSSQFEDEETS